MPNAASFRRGGFRCASDDVLGRYAPLRVFEFGHRGVESQRRAVVRPSPHEDRTSARRRRCGPDRRSTPGFSPAVVAALPTRTTVADGGDRLMAPEAQVRPSLEVIEPGFGCLLVLETLFHAPSVRRPLLRKSSFTGVSGCRVADKEFHSQNVAHVASALIKCNGSDGQAVLDPWAPVSRAGKPPKPSAPSACLLSLGAASSPGLSSPASSGGDIRHSAPPRCRAPSRGTALPASSAMPAIRADRSRTGHDQPVKRDARHLGHVESLARRGLT